MEFEKVIENRYSVRAYLDKKVEDEKIEKLLHAGIIAPTAKNTQPLKIYLLKSEDALKTANEFSKNIRNASLVFVMCYDKDTECVSELNGIRFGEQDICIACTHVMLEAYNIGLGSCWVGMFDKVKCKELLDIPSNIEPVCLLTVGYEAKDSKPSDRHFQNKDVKEVFEIR